MFHLARIGSVFYGIAIGGLGFLTIYYHDFPYMLIPPHNSWIQEIKMIIYIFGALFILAGTSIVFEKKGGTVSLLLGGALLLNFCFYFIPYQFFADKNYMHFGDWENAAKELALSGGAFVVAAWFFKNNDRSPGNFLQKLMDAGTVLYAITIISFSIDHFLYAKEAADYVPSWIPYHLFWIYFCGIALAASGIAILLKIKMKLAATLLGAMIFTWFVILHIPYVIAATSIEEKSGEAASALLALAYSGIALVIAGSNASFLQPLRKGA